MKRMFKRMLAAAFILCLLITLAVPACAEEGDTWLFVFVGSENDSGRYDSSMGVPFLHDGKVLVYADADAYYGENRKHIIETFEGDQYDITWLGIQDPNGEVGLFEVTSGKPDALKVAPVQKYDDIMVAFMYPEGDTLIQDGVDASLTDYEETDNGYELSVKTYAEATIGTSTNGNAYICAVATKEYGCIGVRTPQGHFVTLDPDIDNTHSRGGSDDESGDEDGESFLDTLMENKVVLIGVVAAVCAAAYFFKKKKQPDYTPPMPPVQPPYTPYSSDMDSRIPSGPVMSPDPMISTGPAVSAGPYIPTEPADSLNPMVPPSFDAAPQPQSGNLILRGIGGAMDGYRIPVTTMEMGFGREADNKVRYPGDAKGISRHHCKLFWHNGVLMLMDTGSSCGTFLRGQGQLPPHQPVALRVGDTFYLAEKKNAFYLKEE